MKLKTKNNVILLKKQTTAILTQASIVYFNPKEK